MNESDKISNLCVCVWQQVRQQRRGGAVVNHVVLLWLFSFFLSLHNCLCN